MTPGSGGSTAIAIAGRPSVTRLSQRICSGSSGIGVPASGPRTMTATSARLPLRMLRMNLRMLSKTTRPSRTAPTIVAKLSSCSTMSPASLVTSVPVMPIATPMSACLSAGASLTPSPVIATTSPSRCSASTMRSLSSGDTRA